MRCSRREVSRTPDTLARAAIGVAYGRAMGFLDNVRKKAEKAVDQHGDKISKGIDKAAATASKKTGGKHDDKIAKGVSSTKNALDKLDGRNDDIPDDPKPKPHPQKPHPPKQ